MLSGIVALCQISKPLLVSVLPKCSIVFSPKSQDFWSSDLLIIICKLGMLGFFFNMAPLSTIHLQTILGFLNQVLRILVKILFSGLAIYL